MLSVVKRIFEIIKSFFGNSNATTHKVSKLPSIKLTNEALKINDSVVVFPISLIRFQEVINDFNGEGLNDTLNYFDKTYGINLYQTNKKNRSKEHFEISSIELIFVRNEFSESKTVFTGEVLIEEKDAWQFYKNNPDRRVKQNLSDKTGSVTVGNTSLHYGVTDLKLEWICIEKKQDVEKVLEAVKLDEKYHYLKQLWESWICETASIIPQNNRFYNLKHGVSEDEIKKYMQITKHIAIPDELVNFYKVHNVKFDFVTSAFQIATVGWSYSLIEFKDIQKEWQGIQNLYLGDDIEDELLKDFSVKVKATDYANPNWIPFATGHNGDYLLFDSDPSEKGVFGQIIELENESWARRVVAVSIKELIEQQIERIQSGNTEYLEYVIEHNHKKF